MAAEVERMEDGTRERQPGEGRNKSEVAVAAVAAGRPLGVIAPVAKATAVLARDLAMVLALLYDKGRAQTKEAVVIGS